MQIRTVKAAPAGPVPTPAREPNAPTGQPNAPTGQPNAPTGQPKVPTGQPNAPTQSPWQNPAAAAALRSSAQMLKGVEDGITQNFSNVDRVREFASDLRSTNELLSAAVDMLTTDELPQNDQFLPLLAKASSGVTGAEMRLNSKEITSTWPFERGEILSAVRQARLLSDNTSRSLA